MITYSGPCNDDFSAQECFILSTAPTGGGRTIELFSGGKIIKIFSPLIVICLTRSVKDWIKKLILSFPDLIVSIQRSLIREKIE